MGSELQRMIRDGAPPAWTGPMVLVAIVIADDARDPSQGVPDDGGWPWSALPVEGHWTHRGWRDGLTERTGMSVRSISRALTALAAAGYEMREPVGKGKDGRVVFTAPGHAMRFRVPPLPPRPDPERPPSTATIDEVRSPSTATITPGSEAVPAENGRQKRRERSPKRARTVAKHGDPIPPGPPIVPSTPSHPAVDLNLEGDRQPETIKRFGGSSDEEDRRRAAHEALTKWQREHPEAGDE